jgi:hypothetical protein
VDLPGPPEGFQAQHRLAVGPPLRAPFHRPADAAGEDRREHLTDPLLDVDVIGSNWSSDTAANAWPSPPGDHRLPGHHPAGDLRVRRYLRGQRHDPRPLRQPGRHCGRSVMGAPSTGQRRTPDVKSRPDLALAGRRSPQQVGVRPSTVGLDSALRGRSRRVLRGRGLDLICAVPVDLLLRHVAGTRGGFPRVFRRLPSEAPSPPQLGQQA